MPDQQNQLTPAEYQEHARAKAFKVDPRMEEIDRMYREDRAKYDALPAPLHIQHGLYRDMRGDKR